jgi:serine/threonine protein kinase
MVTACLTQHTPSPLVGGRYRLLYQLGTPTPYALTQVFLAEDTQCGQRVVLKRLAPGLGERSAALGRACLEREQEYLQRLHHPGITRLLAVLHAPDGTPQLVIEYIEGATLEELFAMQSQRRGGQPFPLAFALQVGIALCDILAYLHEQRPAILHRDLKPANILLTSQGQVFLVDFGIALPGDFVPVTPFERVQWQLGSYGYAPPEQYEEIGEPTPQLDLFSLGVLLHFMLTGENPADRPRDREQLFQFAPAGPGLLRLLLVSLLQREARYRPPCARYVGQQLEAALRQHTLQQEGARASILA